MPAVENHGNNQANTLGVIMYSLSSRLLMICSSILQMIWIVVLLLLSPVSSAAFVTGTLRYVSTLRSS